MINEPIPQTSFEQCFQKWKDDGSGALLNKEITLKGINVRGFLNKSCYVKLDLLFQHLLGRTKGNYKRYLSQGAGHGDEI